MSSMSVLGVLDCRIHTCRGIWIARSSFTRSIRPGVSLPWVSTDGPKSRASLRSSSGVSSTCSTLACAAAVPTKKLVRSSRRRPAQRGLEQRAGELDPARRRGLELVRVDEPEVRAASPRGRAPGSLSGRSRTVPVAVSSCFFPVSRRSRSMRSASPSSRPRQLAPLVGHADGRQLQRGARQLERCRWPGRANGAADPRVGLETAAQAGRRVGRQQRLEQREVEAVGAHRERDRVRRESARCRPRPTVSAA